MAMYVHDLHCCGPNLVQQTFIIRSCRNFVHQIAERQERESEWWMDGCISIVLQHLVSIKCKYLHCLQLRQLFPVGHCRRIAETVKAEHNFHSFEPKKNSCKFFFFATKKNDLFYLLGKVPQTMFSLSIWYQWNMSSIFRSRQRESHQHLSRGSHATVRLVSRE